MQNDVIVAGFGGQGVLLIGKMLAYAGMREGKEVSWLPSYGPEMRGGTANCTVVISDRPVGSPVIQSPRAVIAMNLPSLDKFEPNLRSGGVLLINSSLINRDARRDGHGVPGAGQRPPEADDGLGGNLGPFRCGLDVGVGQHTVQELSVFLRPGAALDRDAGQRQGQDALASGLRSQPLVGVRSGLGEPWTHVHETRTAVRVGGDVACNGELPLVFRRRETGVEDLVSKVHHQVRVGEVEPRLGVHSQDVPGRLAQCLGGEGLVDRAAGGSDGTDEVIDQRSRGVTGVTAQHVDLVRRLCDFQGEQLDSRFPADRPEGTGPVLEHGAPEAIRVVGAADRGLPPRAKRPPVDRVLRVSLELDGPPLEGLDMETTGRGTFPAGRGVVERKTRRDRLGLDHVGDQPLDMVGAAGRRSGSGAGSDELQKIATVDLRHSSSSGSPRPTPSQ